MQKFSSQTTHTYTKQAIPMGLLLGGGVYMASPPSPCSCLGKSMQTSRLRVIRFWKRWKKLKAGRNLNP